MSGLLFGAGLCLLSTVPAIEQRTGRFRLLVLLIFIAGIGRLIGFFLTGIASFSVVVGLTLELFVAPILALWQTRVANRYAETAGIADLNKDAIWVRQPARSCGLRQPADISPLCRRTRWRHHGRGFERRSWPPRSRPIPTRR
jgi:hypothetical protein